MSDIPEPKRTTPEDVGAHRVKCIRDWVYQCPECDESFAVQYEEDGKPIDWMSCPNCFAELHLLAEWE